MLTDGRLWLGIVVGVVSVYLWHMWQAKRANSA